MGTITSIDKVDVGVIKKMDVSRDHWMYLIQGMPRYIGTKRNCLRIARVVSKKMQEDSKGTIVLENLIKALDKKL